MKKNILFSVSVFALLFTTPALAQESGLETLFKDGSFFGEVRYRYEGVEQDNALQDADAHTIRTNIGFKTGAHNGFSALGELQFVQGLGDGYNSLDNGQTNFSVVADPDVTQINRAWVAYDGIADTEIKLGRQALNFDNQRFIGTVGWRQNDQTFDALTLTNTSVDNLNIKYSYLANVNRIFAGSTPADDLDSKSHLVNASYKASDSLKLSAYGYALDFKNAAALSNKTYGVRATGKTTISDGVTLGYEAEYATQDDYGDNPNNYSEDYYHIAPSLSAGGFKFKLGYEVLGGDGTNAFQTPLATLHKFNGWADIFLNTPANGLEDAYVGASYKVSDTKTLLDGAKIGATYHDFSGDEAGDLGSELDLSLAKKFKLPDVGQPYKDVNISLKYSDYNADDAPYVDTQKIWVQLGIKF